MSRVIPLAAELVIAIAWCIVADADEKTSFRSPDASRDRILAELKENTDLEFADTPLSDVVDFIKNKHNIEIQLDAKGLTDAAVDPSAPIKKSVKGISLRPRLLLEEFDLTIVIQDEVLKITSKEKADEILTTEIYPVGDLLSTGPGQRGNLDRLVDIIESTIMPDTWGDNGGPGSITPYRETLVVSQKFDVHEEVADLLALLRAALPVEKIADAPTPTQAGATEAVEEMRIVLYGLAHMSVDEAQQAIMTLVEPDSWRAQGGLGAAYGLTSFPQPTENRPAHMQVSARKVLAVRHTDDVHAKIRDLLRKLDQGPHVSFGSIFPGPIPTEHSQPVDAPAAP